jgi:galactokinase
MLSMKLETEQLLAPAARADRMRQRFREKFGGEPELWARAPGRVDLMGSHTDYNRGFVLTLPLSRETWIAARLSRQPVASVHSINLDADDRFPLESIRRADQRWGDYVRGVVATLMEAGFRCPGFEAVIHSTVPIGSGLSSSAALECATAVVCRALGGWQLDPCRMAELCQQAENKFVGVNCGILDQYSSCLGRQGCALLLDCSDLSNRPVHIAEGIRVVICDTRTPRELHAGDYARRRAQCEQGAAALGVPALRFATEQDLEASSLSGDVLKRCRFIVAENARVLALAAALESGDRQAIGALCRGSFTGARDLFEICSPSMSAMMNGMSNARGAIGARQAGAGFGGCMVALVDADRTEDFRDDVSAAYERATGIPPEIYAVEAAPAAGLMQAP